MDVEDGAAGHDEVVPLKEKSNRTQRTERRNKKKPDEDEEEDEVTDPIASKRRRVDHSD